MNITPQRGRGGSGTLRAVALSAGAAAALGCEYLLASSHDRDQSAISGELLNGGAAAEPGGITAWLFNYFGNVSYFFPLLLVFFAWQLSKGRLSLRQTDFFTVGIRLLGFNVLLMGLCALMSSLFVAGATGAGGILGDFLNILFFSKIPRPVAPLAPILLTMAGVMMFFAHSPWWFCDRIGEGVARILRIDKGEAAGDQDGGAKEKAEPKVDPAAAPGGLRLERRKQKKEAAKAPEPPRSFDGKDGGFVSYTSGVSPEDAPIGAAPAPSPKQKIAPEPQHGRVEPSFGPVPNPSRFAKSDEMLQKEPGEAPADDPRIGATRITIERCGGAAPAAPAPYDGAAMHGRSAEDDYAQAMAQPSGAGRAEPEAQGPATIISRAPEAPCPDPYATPGAAAAQAPADQFQGSQGLQEPAYANARQQYQDERDQGRQDPDVGGARTIITMGGCQGVQDAPAPQAPEERHAGSDGPVYQAGAPGVKSETVGNPEGRGEVSTVITRGDSVTRMQFGQHVDDFSGGDGRQGGSYTERDSMASVPPDTGTLMDERMDGAGAGPITMEEGGFTVTPYGQDGKPEEESSRNGMDPMRLHEKEAPISEKDRDFASSFTGATRGLHGAPESVHEAAAPTQGASEGSDQENPAQGQGHGLAQAGRRSAGKPCAQAAGTEAGYNAMRGALQHGAALEPSDEERAAFASAADDPENAAEGFGSYDPEEDREELSEGLGQGGDEASASSDDSGDAGSPEEPQAGSAQQEPPHADIHKFATREYQSSMITVPGNSEPEDPWRPPFSLLESSDPASQGDASGAEARQTAEAIDKCLREFGVDARVVDYEPGPVITCFHLLPGVGTRISKIANLQPDMCRVLGTPNLRVIDTIRGTQHIGLEVPNAHRKTISMREVVESEAFVHTKAALPLCLGENTVGEPVVADLATAPHLLIAGTTGSGKSIGINGMLLSLLLSRSPSEMRLILVDPKQVEFALYEGLPHLICPVISEPKETMAALEWCVAEMDRRYGILSAMRVRSLSEYNAYIRAQNAQGRLVYDPAWSADMGGSPSQMKPLPTIVMVIDEFADLMQAFDGRRNGKGGPAPDMLVQRIAQKARAAGIHLMLATQSPRSDVITGTLKSNLPSRIAYTVGSALDSRVILDSAGAENLLGYGDLLASIQHLNRSQIFRAHGPFARNEEVEAVVGAWKDHCGDPQYVQGVTDYHDEEEDEGMQDDGSQGQGRRDELYDRVLAHVRDYQNENGGRTPSITSLQVAFGIGYPRAKKILAQMNKAGDI